MNRHVSVENRQRLDLFVRRTAVGSHVVIQREVAGAGRGIGAVCMNLRPARLFCKQTVDRPGNRQNAGGSQQNCRRRLDFKTFRAFLRKINTLDARLGGIPSPCVEPAHAVRESLSKA